MTTLTVEMWYNRLLIIRDAMGTPQLAAKARRLEK
jgi:hypothetical protein